MNRKIVIDLTDPDQKSIFAPLVSALNESGITWGIELDPCTYMIVIEIGEGY